MKIIPAIDILNGKCVRLYKGDYNQQVVFHENPVVMAQELHEAGFKYLHLVDLDGARGSGNNRQVLKNITQNTALSVDFGGGLKKIEDVEQAFDLGAEQVNIGSMAVRNEKEFFSCLKRFQDQIVWNADLKDGKLAVHGWQETVDDDFGKLVTCFSEFGLKNILTTDISRDGTLTGPNFRLYEDLINLFPGISWIASGGITTKEDVIQLRQLGIAGAVIGKALYTKNITYQELLEIQDAD